MPRPLDISGSRFNRLVAVSPVTDDKRRKWLCKCDCGQTATVITANLMNGNSKSCGCLAREASASNAKSNITHGRSNKPGDGTYSSWSAMHERGRMNYKKAKDYAARGIKVCERWKSFELFLEDMGERPDGKTLDRIDVNGDYEPGNCRWATLKVQQRNRRNTSYMTTVGSRRACVEVAEDLGIPNTAMKYFRSVYLKLNARYGDDWSVDVPRLEVADS